jgi:uncharacterized protein YeaO (DUF488 family)
MSFESTDEKIERLETTVQGLINLCEDMRRSQSQGFLSLVKLIVGVKNENLSLLRFWATCPVPDKQMREWFRDQIARLEQSAERIEYELAQSQAKLEMGAPDSPFSGG